MNSETHVKVAWEKNNQTKKTEKNKKKINKSWKKSIKILKNWLVRFGFINLKLKKPNRIQTKKTRKNRAKSKNLTKLISTGFYIKKPNQTKTNQFKLVWFFLILIYFFLIKTKPNKKYHPGNFFVF
jgi:hypothetical protein